MQVLHFLAQLHNPVLDFIFQLITEIGNETVFLVVAILFFWCINKREGYYILMTGLLGTLVNQFLKIICRVPRPWVRDPMFKHKVVPSAFEGASGYSFPSGHTQNIAGTFGCIGRYNRQRWLKITCLVIILLVAFSRMYLGVHTPLDVTVSLVVAAALVFGLHFVFRTEESAKKYMPWLILASVILSAVFILFVFLIPDAKFSGVSDFANLQSARKNAATLVGCLVGLALVYPLDIYYTKFDTKARWYAQLVKFALGVAIVLGIKIGLSQPLVSLFGNEYVARSVRYFLIVAFAGGLWPMTFKHFAKMKVEKLDRFGQWVASKLTKKETATAE